MTSQAPKPSKRKKRKSDAFLIVAIVILFLIGAGLMIYPDVASWQASRSHAGIIQVYHEEVADIAEDAIAEHFERARHYNASLVGSHIEDPFVQGSGQVLPSDYYEILNVNGAMGAIEIPAIDIQIPIFHGTGEAVLMRGVGHIPNTPFPIGQLGKHAVLTGHTGIPSSRLFTDLELLNLDDIFVVTVLDKRMMYRVDQIKVVLPHEISELRNVADEDLITLVTCTPYGINSHRLLVRGRRIPYEEANVIAENVEVLVQSFNWRILLVAGMSLVFIFIWLLYSIKSRRNQD
ncbi:MAG: class C sortase [Turicibacter sp.]|nr:class C sortase [Turicibacter sp.]